MRGRCLILAKAPLHDVIGDLSAGLEALGWQVDRRTWSVPKVPQSPAWRRLESTLSSRIWIVRTCARAMRRLHRELAGAAAASPWLEETEGLLGRTKHDVVLAFLDGLPIGVARLAARLHPRVVLVSLVAITQEQRHRRTLPVLRALAQVAARRPLHPDVLRPIPPDAIPTVVFPTQGWRDAAVAVGVPSRCAEVITLGVPIPGNVARRDSQLPTPARLLWLGRLSPEKGLHLFVDAMSIVSAQRPVHLTAIAAPGPVGYAQLVRRTIADRGLQSVVDLLPAVPRHALSAVFQRHDLLLFYSVFGEPVAQVMLHAAAAGLPVVGPASGRPESLLREGHTAWCFTDASPERIADAILRALDAGDERNVRARALGAEIRAGHALADTIARFDVTMRVCAGRNGIAEAEWQTAHS